MQTTPDAIANTEAILAAFSERLLSSGPAFAETLASALCSEWYVCAPELQRCREGMAAHPLGEWPNVPPMLLLDELADTTPFPDAALVLTRALLAPFAWADEAMELTARIETRLLARGAQAPPWSTQHDAWELADAWEVRVLNGPDDEYGDRIMDLLWFDHPCGQGHGLCLTIDQHNFSHIHTACTFDDLDMFLEEVRSEVRDEPGVVIAQPDRRSLGHAIARSVKKTYLHEFEPLRHAPGSIALLALIKQRERVVLQVFEEQHGRRLETCETTRTSVT
ncbi:MAG: hypothetical protein JWM98_2353 [Thermoleophilia bacterium]|nr:hypothetical protein [Thermoleophilia bacterium]